MLNVCRNHVKNGLKDLDVPHVKKVKEKNLICSFCHKDAEINIFVQIPSPEKYYKANENDTYCQY